MSHRLKVLKTARMVWIQNRKTVWHYCRMAAQLTVPKDGMQNRTYRMAVLQSDQSMMIYVPRRSVIFEQRYLRQVFVQMLCGMIPKMSGMNRFSTVHKHQSGMPSMPILAALQQISFSMIP